MIRLITVFMLSGVAFGLYFSLLVTQKFPISDSQNMITMLLFMCACVNCAIVLLSFIGFVRDIRRKLRE